MPIYEYICQDCGKGFEIWIKSFDERDIVCPDCQSHNIKKLMGAFSIRMGKISEPTSEFAAKDEAINYYKKKGRFDLAAKEAEKAGKSEWEIKRIREGKDRL